MDDLRASQHEAKWVQIQEKAFRAWVNLSLASDLKVRPPEEEPGPEPSGRGLSGSRRAACASARGLGPPPKRDRRKKKKEKREKKRAHGWHSPTALPPVEGPFAAPSGSLATRLGFLFDHCLT